MQEIKITGDMIRLGQLLKLGGVVDSGGEGKDLLAAEAVLVNGSVETRRGRQLHDGDVVEVQDWEFRISSRSA
jgi:ribosome-associated protein